MIFRLFVAALFASLATLFTASASAQAITIVQEASLPRLDKDGNQIGKRALQLTPEAVSLQDCVDDQKIRFPLQMSGFVANASVQAWASNGAECTSALARAGASKQCWRILDSEIPLTPVQNVDIPVRAIMAGAFPNTAQQADPSAKGTCGKINLSTISVRFLYFAPGNQSDAVSEKTIGVIVDTVGPTPPSGLSAKPGDTRIQVTWVNISGGSGDAAATGGLTELTGVKVYCDVAGSAADAGTTAPVCHDEQVDAGVDDAGTPITTTVQVCEDAGTTETPAGCSSANFTKSDGTKVFPTAEFNAKYECGSIVGNTGSSVVAKDVGGAPLVNGTNYAVAVANTDKFGNVGELSGVICMTPEITTDFWDDYRKAGGQAGGGCATNASPGPSFAVGAIGIGFVTLAFSRRRRKRGSASSLPRTRAQDSKGKDA
jgi:hypothetical protein